MFALGALDFVAVALTNENVYKVFTSPMLPPRCTELARQQGPARQCDSEQSETMKLIRFGPPGKENPGILLEDRTRLDVYGFVSHYDEHFSEMMEPRGSRRGSRANPTPASQVRASVRLVPAVC